MSITERRRNARHMIKHDVVLCCGHLGLVRGKASDISVNGMFVLTGRAKIDLDTKVEVCFGVEEGGQHQFHRLMARVVRIDAAGLGLQFLKTQANTLKVFLQGGERRLAS